MGEYARLNRKLREEEDKLSVLKAIPNKTDEVILAMADIEQGIGEIRGALFEMAEVDGLNDHYEAFDIFDF